ncbi:hypothetical protein LUZ60_011318 [Juncus effusus]|nr:hypothetical protein LUZ60_011318 [Juncus effusus]
MSSTVYFCHLCDRRVTPLTDPDLKCPNCDTGFIEELRQDEHETLDSAPINFRSEQRSLSSWAPVLLGMMNHHNQNSSDPDSDSARILRRGIRRERDPEQENQEEQEEEEEEEGSDFDEDESEIDREIEDIFRRSRRRTAILQLLESLRDDMRTETEEETEAESDSSLILINRSNNHAIILPNFDSSDSNSDFNLDLLLQHLAETDPNRYGSPPAKPSAIEALPSVAISEELSCSVCLEEFEMGEKGKEMPCKHKFHESCILKWLELHSSCPVCRFEIEGEERKEDEEWGTGDDGNNGSGSEANPSSSTEPS